MAATDQPSQTQLLFARAVMLTMDLWPAMRLAVSEQWGGQESAEKRDFLVSHICDTYSNEASTEAHSGVVASPVAPDIDDLAETLEMYFADEYESRIEDGSADWVAGRIAQLHKIVYSTFPPTPQSIANAESEVERLNQAATQLRGQKVSVQRSNDEQEEDASGSEGESAEEDDSMQVDEEPQAKPQRQEPVVDEDGFTTVVKGKRRA